MQGPSDSRITKLSKRQPASPASSPGGTTVGIQVWFRADCAGRGPGYREGGVLYWSHHWALKGGGRGGSLLCARSCAGRHLCIRRFHSYDNHLRYIQLLPASYTGN